MLHTFKAELHMPAFLIAIKSPKMIINEATNGQHIILMFPLRDLGYTTWLPFGELTNAQMTVVD